MTGQRGPGLNLGGFSLIAAFYYILVSLIWGSSWLVITFQLGEVDERLSVAYRFLLASLVLFLWCRMRGLPLRCSPQQHLWIAAQGASLFAVNYWLFYYSERYVTSGLVAVLFCSILYFNCINSTLFLRRRLNVSVLIGGAVGIFGLVLLFAPEIERIDYGLREWTAVAVAVVASYFSSVGNILSVRNQGRGIPVTLADTWGMAYGGALMLVFVFATGGELAFDFSLRYVSSLLFLSFFASVIAFGAYLSLAGSIGPEKASCIMVFLPLVAILLSNLFEGYELGLTVLAGLALVVVGNIISVRRQAWH